MPDLDNDDVQILKYLCKIGDFVTTTDLAKKMFNIKNEYELKKKDNFIRSRLNQLVKKKLLITKKEDRYTNYYLSENCMVLHGIPKISINGDIFEGSEGDYVFIIKKGFLDKILS